VKIRRWTLEDTATGRELLREAFLSMDRARLEVFYDWVGCNVRVNIGYFRETMDRLFRYNDADRAQRMYDAMMFGYNPRREAVGVLLVVALRVLLLAGAIGGCVYLWRAC